MPYNWVSSCWILNGMLSVSRRMDLHCITDGGGGGGGGGVEKCKRKSIYISRI